MREHTKGDTSKVIYAYMVDSTDHVAEETGLTVSAAISKNGAAFSAATGTVAEVGNGLYKLTPSSGDIDTAGPMVVRFTATGADPYVVELNIVEYNSYDPVRMGLTALPNAAADAAGGLPVSDAGGLDLDAIKAKTDNLPNDPAGVSDVGTAAKLLTNKAVQNKVSGEIVYYDDDGTTPILTHTPTDDGSSITRTPS